jgi:hypothetical protein
MECDSIHASIEHAKILKNTCSISVGNSYIVSTPEATIYCRFNKYTEILDYKLYKEQNFGKMKIDVDKERVNWLKIKWIKVPRKAYTGKLPISAAKKADLMSLVASGTIPKEYESYFESLPCSKSIKDKLPVPSVSESEGDE